MTVDLYSAQYPYIMYKSWWCHSNVVKGTQQKEERAQWKYIYIYIYKIMEATRHCIFGTKAQHHLPVHTAHGLCLRQGCPCSHNSWTVLEARLSLFTQLMDCAWGKTVPVHTAHGLCAWGKAVTVHTAHGLCLRQGCPCSQSSWTLCLRQGCPCSHSSCAWDKAVPVHTVPVLETRLSLFTQLLCLRQGCPFWHSSCAWDKAVVLLSRSHLCGRAETKSSMGQ